MKLKAFLVLILFCFSGIALAENGCPEGYTPWRIPMESPNDCAAIQTNNNQPQAPREVWEPRWGAIAIDNEVSTGGFGAVTDGKTKRQATKAAIAQCKANGGGKGCKIKVAYSNQCAVVAWGDTKYSYANAATIKQASDLGLQDCGKLTTNCKIFYADCSLAERVR